MSIEAIKAIDTEALLRATNQFHRTVRTEHPDDRPLFAVAAVPPSNKRERREWITDLRSNPPDPPIM